VQGLIVDFLAPAAKLVVEVDGVQHARRRQADARRGRALEAAGLRVLRLPAQLVLRDVQAAVRIVVAALTTC
jgi:very-short-patch-repair endonuclease